MRLQLFLELWYVLPIGWRRLLIPAPLAGCAIGAGFSWDWFVLIPGAVVSLILLILPGPSAAEKKGYNF